jgi:ATP-dependent Clp protease ATP-binding subunit ClpC
VFADEEMRSFGHVWLGTEHLLLGVLHDQDSAAAAALRALGIELMIARAAVLRALGRGEQRPEGQVPFTEPAVRALKLAAAQAGGRMVEPEHILLALVAEPDGGAAEIILTLGATADQVRLEVNLTVGEPGETLPPRPPWPPDELVADGELNVGWRGRPILLAALGAATLTRWAFDETRLGARTPLEMQVLAHLALLAGADRAFWQPGEELYSMPRALAYDPGELDQAIRLLVRDGLVVRPDETDEASVAITTSGLLEVEAWLARIVSLFGGWPPDRPDVDDPGSR